MSPAQRLPPTALSGFTLLELIVVLAIFAIFSLMAYGGLDSVLQTRAQVEEALQRTATAQKAYIRLRDDFQQIRNRPVRDGFGDTQPPIRTDRLGRVELTRGGWRNPLTQPRAGLERVSYRLDGKKFKRESWRVLDQAQDSKVVELVLFDNVKTLSWRLLDANREWHRDWPPEDPNRSRTQQAPLPIAVEITLDTEDWGELKFLFRLGLEVPKISDFGSPGPNPGGGSQQQDDPPASSGGDPNEAAGGAES